jgi:hypothetical protein
MRNSTIVSLGDHLATSMGHASTLSINIGVPFGVDAELSPDGRVRPELVDVLWAPRGYGSQSTRIEFVAFSVALVQKASVLR